MKQKAVRETHRRLVSRQKHHTWKEGLYGGKAKATMGRRTKRDRILSQRPFSQSDVARSACSKENARKHVRLAVNAANMHRSVLRLLSQTPYISHTPISAHYLDPWHKTDP